MELSKRLQPWMDILATYTLRWTREGDSVLFLGMVDVTDRVRAQNPDQLLRVRELFDIMRLLSIADPAQFVQLLEQQSNSHWHNLQEERELMCAIARGVPIELKFGVDLSGNHLHLLTPRLSDFFSNECSAPSRGSFADERQRLVELLTDAQWKLLQHRPVQVRLDVITETQGHPQSLASEDLFVDLTKFATAVTKMQPASTIAELEARGRLLPIALEGMKLGIRDVSITPRVVQKATDLVATGVPIKLRDVDLDPQLVQCSDVELHRFLECLTKAESNLKVFIGLQRQGRVIDSRGQDRTELLRTVINAINSLPKVFALNVTFLLQLFAAPQHRRLVFRELLVPVFARSTPVSQISLSAATMTADDIDSFRSAAEAWREANPGKLLRGKYVSFDNNGRSARVNEFAAILDDAESVRIQSVSLNEPPGTRSVVRTVLRYPSLKTLSIQDCVIDSMDVFDPLVADPDIPVKPVLRALTLTNFVLHDRLSMRRFLQQLKDTSHPLSKSLQRLYLQGDVQSSETYSLDEIGSQLLADALHANRVLADVEVGVAPLTGGFFDLPDHARIRAQAANLQSTRRRCVPHLDLRRTERVRARSLAFLSVVRSSESSVPSACRRLDAVVLNMIFNSSAPHRMRQISVTTLRANEDNDDDSDY